jgi:hypothetical protein
MFSFLVSPNVPKNSFIFTKTYLNLNVWPIYKYSTCDVSVAYTNFCRCAYIISKGTHLNSISEHQEFPFSEWFTKLCWLLFLLHVVFHFIFKFHPVFSGSTPDGKILRSRNMISTEEKILCHLKCFSHSVAENWDPQVEYYSFTWLKC